jgi:hypothetical protein
MQAKGGEWRALLPSLMATLRLFPECLHLLRLLVVQPPQFGAPLTVGTQEFIELGVYRLHVTVLRALDEKGHAERREGEDFVPVERCAVKDQPDCNIRHHYQKCGWTRQPRPRVGQQMGWMTDHIRKSDLCPQSSTANANEPALATERRRC